jgi:ammonium transporter Rh
MDTPMTEESSLLPVTKPSSNPYSTALAYSGKLGNGLMALQVGLVLVFLFATTYPDADDYSPAEYYIWKDIMAMLLIGFGFLMTFLKQYGLGAVGFTMLLTVMSMQLNIVIELIMRVIYGFITSTEMKDTSFPMPIGMSTIIDSQFSAATLLISFGAIIGRASPYQMLVMTVSQSFFYAFNKVFIVFGILAAEDVGGTMTIHMFGAYFGLAASMAMGASPPEKGSPEADKVSDLFAMIGTTVLWIFWPSFVGATETGTAVNEMRCTTNTIISLMASTGVSFWASQKLCKGKFDPVHIANSTLAGGVAIGSTARLNMGPGVAAVIGMMSGIVSVYGYVYSSPALEEVGIFDTCGVGNLHGLPSLIGGLASVAIVAMDPTAEFLNHNAYLQPFMQLLGVILTVVISATSGYATGIFMKSPTVVSSKNDSPVVYEDEVYWHAEYFE